MKKVLWDQSRNHILVEQEVLMYPIPFHSDVRTVCDHRETRKNLSEHREACVQYQNKQTRLQDESAFLRDL